jgi:hypothetical protein
VFALAAPAADSELAEVEAEELLGGERSHRSWQISRERRRGTANRPAQKEGAIRFAGTSLVRMN